VYLTLPHAAALVSAQAQEAALSSQHRGKVRVTIPIIAKVIAIVVIVLIVVVLIVVVLIVVILIIVIILTLYPLPCTLHPVPCTLSPTCNPHQLDAACQRGEPRADPAAGAHIRETLQGMHTNLLT
jgi:hypothetical protein